MPGADPRHAPSAESGATSPSAETRPDGGESIHSGVEVPPELVDHPRYRILRPIGRGGMGAIFLAEHRKMERKVALKVIHPRLTSDPKVVKRFLIEMKAASRLNHPNIVTAFDADEAGANERIHFLVMEYVEGDNLASYMKTRGPLPVAEACDYARQAALGLQHAHECGMVHRDVKPHNLFRTPSGQIKILDFGLARLSMPEGQSMTALTGQGTFMGTVDYISPEQADDSRSVDIRADIYSLGCTLYHLLAGRVPFPSGSAVDKMFKHTMTQPTPLRQLRPELPPALTAIVSRMMAKVPEDRYPLPADVAAALEPFTAAASSSGSSRSRLHAVPTPPPLPRRTSWLPWLVGIAAAVLVLGILLIRRSI